MKEEIYAVKVVCNDEDGTIVRFLNNQFFLDKEEARNAMLKDFNEEKSEAESDNIDNVTVDISSFDSLSLSINNGEVDRNWDIIRLTAFGFKDED